MLKNDIDILMLPYEFTEPDLYNQYCNLRRIDDLRKRKRNTDTEPDSNVTPAQV